MRNFTLLKRLAVLPLAAVLAFTSCENKTMDSSCTVTSSDIDLKANPVRVAAPAAGKIYKLNVQVSGDVTWTAKSNNTNLVTVSKTDIQNTSGELLLTVTANTTYGNRTGVITIESPALYSPVTINITQPASGAPTVHVTLLEGKNALDIKAVGDTLRYEITSEPVTPLTYQIDPASTEWISTVEGKTTEWIFAKNETVEPRSSWVAIKYNSGTNAVDTIYFTQNGMGKPAISISPNPVGSFEIKDVNGAKTIDEIDYTAKDFAFTITTLPVTGLAYKSDAEWLVKKTGAELTWTVNENISTSPRTAKLYIEYGAKNYKLDSITFVQKGATSAKTPTVTVADGDIYTRMATLKWATTPEVLGSISTMHIKVGDADVVDVAVEKGMLTVAIAPNTVYNIVATATAKDGEVTQPYNGSFTSKRLTDTYTFKDGKMKENLASWLSAKRDPYGRPANASVYLVNGGISYDTLEMVTDLKLTYQFGQTAGMTDLLPCVNLKNIQLGRGYYDEGIGFGNVPKFKEYLQAVLTKANFPSFIKIGIGKGTTSVPAAVKAAVQEVCTANSITFVDEINLLWPNEVVYNSNTIQSMSASVADMQLLDRSAWKSVAWSTSEPVGEGASGRMGSLFDNDFGTYWHSQWYEVQTPVTMPHVFVMDLGKPTTFNAIVMSNRVNGNADSRPYVYTVEFSNDVPTTWGDPTEVSVAEPAGLNWTSPVQVVNDPSANSTSASVSTNTFKLLSAVTARCIRVKITAVYQFPKNNSCAISEFGIK